MSDIKIPPAGSVKPHEGSFPDDPSSSLSHKLKSLVHELERLTKAMPDSHEDLDKIAKHILEVGKHVKGIVKGSGHEPAEVIHHILNQPLAIIGSTETASLLQAAKNFRKEDPYESDLFKLLSTFHEYPGPTHTLITELEILIGELKELSNNKVKH